MELKAIYEKQEKGIQLNFQLVNTTNQPEDVTFNSGQEFEISIIDEAGEEVYRFSDDRFFTMAMKTKKLAPGEEISWQDHWNYIDKKGSQRNSGRYRAIVSIKARVGEAFRNHLTKEIDINL